MAMLRDAPTISKAIHHGSIELLGRLSSETKVAHPMVGAVRTATFDRQHVCGEQHILNLLNLEDRPHKNTLRLRD